MATDTELQWMVNRASQAMFDVAERLKKNNPELPMQNREILIEIAIDAWIRVGGS